MSTEKLTKSNPLFTSSLIPHGNGKLLDFDNLETGEKIRYAQFNTRAIEDCPFRSEGCEAVCYATKGNHMFPSVIESRIRSYEVSKKENFSETMTYTIRYLLKTKRYRDAIMLIRIHESGDFYSLQYLKKWVRIWARFNYTKKVRFVFYTKSFMFFLMLTEEEKTIIRNMMKAGTLSINLSLDDTTTTEQKIAYLKMLKEFPLCNTYRVTEKVTEKDDKCDCANCAKCGACNTASGKEKVVEIHSASNADKEKYRKGKRSGT